MLVVMAGFTACGSSSTTDEGDGTMVSVPSSPVPASTSPGSPSSTGSTTPSTSTSSTVLVDVEAAVEAAVDLAQESFSACLVAMPSCDPGTLAVARAGDLLERNTARINEWNAAGYTVRNRDQFRYVIEDVTLAPDRATATALVCIADGSDLVRPGAGPGGADVIIDDSFTSGRASWDMRLDADGRWRAYDAPAVGPSESRDVCGGG
jgi:hypothetical protein